MWLTVRLLRVLVFPQHVTERILLFQWCWSPMSEFLCDATTGRCGGVLSLFISLGTLLTIPHREDYLQTTLWTSDIRDAAKSILFFLGGGHFFLLFRRARPYGVMDPYPQTPRDPWSPPTLRRPLTLQGMTWWVVCCHVTSYDWRIVPVLVWPVFGTLHHHKTDLLANHDSKSSNKKNLSFLVHLKWETLCFDTFFCENIAMVNL